MPACWFRKKSIVEPTCRWLVMADSGTTTRRGKSDIIFQSQGMPRKECQSTAYSQQRQLNRLKKTFRHGTCTKAGGP